MVRQDQTSHPSTIQNQNEMTDTETFNSHIWRFKTWQP